MTNRRLPGCSKFGNLLTRLSVLFALALLTRWRREREKKGERERAREEAESATRSWAACVLVYEDPSLDHSGTTSPSSLSSSLPLYCSRDSNLSLRGIPRIVQYFSFFCWLAWGFVGEEEKEEGGGEIDDIIGGSVCGGRSTGCLR